MYGNDSPVFSQYQNCLKMNIKKEVQKQFGKLNADYSLLLDNLKLSVLKKFKYETDELLERI